MNEHGKSDRPAVPVKPPNNAGRPAAEGVEGRGLAKGNPRQQNALRTPSREGALSALERVRQAAERDRKLRFTTLLHHVYDVERLHAAYLALKRDAAAGVDGETWRHYGEALAGNLQDLSERLKRGAYRAKPVRRVFIPKADGRLRPLGVTALEDKIVQRATVEVLNAVYETDFLGFSYGFRPRQTIRKRLQAKLSEVKANLTRRMHDPIPEMGKWLRSVVGGHVRYYGVPMNGPALHVFRFQVGRLWHRALSRRSQNGRVPWDRMRRLIDRWLPPARVCHPYPLRRLGVIT
jgi:hypothetical protein